MKKFSLKTVFIALSALCAFNTTALAADPVAGKEYVEVRKAPSAQKKLLSFSLSIVRTAIILNYHTKFQAKLKSNYQLILN